MFVIKVFGVLGLILQDNVVKRRGNKQHKICQLYFLWQYMYQEWYLDFQHLIDRATIAMECKKIARKPKL